MSFIAVAQQLGSGMLASLSIFVLTLVFSLPLGLLVAFGRKSRIKPVQWLVKLYISIMRGTPLMLQLLVVYFGPYYLFGILLNLQNHAVPPEEATPGSGAARIMWSPSYFKIW